MCNAVNYSDTSNRPSKEWHYAAPFFILPGKMHIIGKQNQEKEDILWKIS